ncbi:MAG: hypothetical protein V1692_01205 [bacterium]
MEIITVSRNIPFPGSCVILVISKKSEKETSDINNLLFFPTRLEFQIPNSEDEDKIYNDVVTVINNSIGTDYIKIKEKIETLWEKTSWNNDNKSLIEIWRYNNNQTNFFFIFLANYTDSISQVRDITKEILKKTDFFPNGGIPWGTPANTYHI